MQIIDRAAARQLGLGWYFTGKPCPAGHVTKRSVSNCECRGCVNVRHKRRREADPELYRARKRARWWRDVEDSRARQRESWRKHRETRRASDRARYPAEAERRKARAKAWQRRNPGMLRYMVARRREHVRRATPWWLSREQRRAIRAVYVEAASRPGDWHVDHIVPLRGKGVCGLNVPWNLQIITAAANRAKSNRFDS